MRNFPSPVWQIVILGVLLIGVMVASPLLSYYTFDCSYWESVVYSIYFSCVMFVICALNINIDPEDDYTMGFRVMVIGLGIVFTVGVELFVAYLVLGLSGAGFGIQDKHAQVVLWTLLVLVAFLMLRAFLNYRLMVKERTRAIAQYEEEQARLKSEEAERLRVDEEGVARLRDERLRAMAVLKKYNLIDTDLFFDANGFLLHRDDNRVQEWIDKQLAVYAGAIQLAEQALNMYLNSIKDTSSIDGIVQLSAVTMSVKKFEEILAAFLCVGFPARKGTTWQAYLPKDSE
jgi:hypothetical protein